MYITIVYSSKLKEMYVIIKNGNYKLFVHFISNLVEVYKWSGYMLWLLKNLNTACFDIRR